MQFLSNGFDDIARKFYEDNRDRDNQNEAMRNAYLHSTELS